MHLRTANPYSLQFLYELGEVSEPGRADAELISGIIWPPENEGFLPRGEGEEPMNQAEGIVPSTRILHVCELMTLQNPEESGERNHQLRHSERAGLEPVR